MASSSTLSCHHFSHTATSDHFRNGWGLRNGHLAQLCPRCASVYEGGKFCETFHSEEDGWRDCESCKKARNQCLSLETLNQIRNAQEVLSRHTHIEPQHWPRATDVELQQILNIPNSTVTPLFEKPLSASDADAELARLVIPKKCAEEFFPIINEPHGFPISILDTDNKEWVFLYRHWPNSGIKLHGLEGLRDYMILKEWQPGDTVTFYRVEPGGKLMMGLRKASEGTAF